MKAKVKSPSSLFDFLKTTIGSASGSKIKRMIKMGSVSVNGTIVLRPDFKISTGQTVVVTRKKEISKVRKAASSVVPFDIIFEDDLLLAVVKPWGKITSAAGPGKKKGFAQEVADYTRFRVKDPCKAFVVKRLDKEISGILLFAKSTKIRDHFRDNWTDVTKRYCALVEGKMPAAKGKMVNFLSRKHSGEVMVIKKGMPTEEAITEFKVLKEFARYSLVELRPETELKYQLRAQLAQLNCPVSGDRKYGSKQNPLNRVALHLHHLSLIHPKTGETLKITTPYPKIFLKVGKKDQNNPS